MKVTIRGQIRSYRGGGLVIGHYFLVSDEALDLQPGDIATIVGETASPSFASSQLTALHVSSVRKDIKN